MPHKGILPIKDSYYLRVPLPEREPDDERIVEPLPKPPDPDDDEPLRKFEVVPLRLDDELDVLLR